MNHNNIDDNIYKKQQQLYCLLKHDSININYQPITDDDIFILEGGDNDINYGSGIYQIGVDLKGISYCKIANLNCTTLSSDSCNEFLSSSESSIESFQINRYGLINQKKVPIFKYGAITNLTVDFIKAIDTKAKLDKIRYVNLIEVEWIEGTEFAVNGDSGSLYIVYDLTTGSFVPVALYMGTKRNRSCDILSTYIFQELIERQCQLLCAIQLPAKNVNLNKTSE
ncbi:unnamed protein product, partial [Rotaria sp. Silwood1]